MHRRWLWVACLLLGCATATSHHRDDAPGTHRSDAHTLVGPRSYLDGWPALAEGGLVNVVVEIPAGSLQKWEVSKPDGLMRWEIREGQPRVVRFVGYPGNYGMIPGTLLDKQAGGDGDPLDVLVLGPPLPRGTVARVRPIGMLLLLDRGETDDKIVAVDPNGPFGQLTSLQELDRDRPGASEMVRLFFTSYKGPGKLASKGWADAAQARATIARAIQSAASAAKAH